MSIFERVKKFFSFYQTRKKYGEFNVNIDRYLPFEKFKQKYLALKKHPDWISWELSGQNLDNLHDDVPKFFFLAIEFPDLFKLKKPHVQLNTTPIANALVKNVINFENLTDVAQMWSAEMLKDIKYNLSISDKDFVYLLIKAIDQNHYWMFLVLYTQYKSNALFMGEKLSQDFNSILNNYIKNAEYLPWFIKLLFPQNEKPVKYHVDNVGSGRLDLHTAVLHEHNDSIKFLLSSEHADVLLKSLDKNNKTPLEIAVENKYQIISNDILANMKEGIPEHKEAVKRAILLSYKNENYSWAVKAAEEFNLLEEPLTPNGLTLIDLLAQMGKLSADTSSHEVSPKQHRSALYRAAYTGKITVVKYLLSKNIKINIEDYTDVRGGKKVGIVENCYALIQEKINPKKSQADILNTLSSKTGDAPLHEAIKLKNSKAMRLLIDNGADIFLENKQSLSVFDLALERNDQDSFNLLVQLVKEKNIKERDKWPSRKIRQERILEFIKNYLQSNPHEKTLETINFFKNYFIIPFAKNTQGSVISYCFEHLSTRVIDDENKKQNANNKFAQLSLGEKVAVIAAKYKKDDRHAAVMRVFMPQLHDLIVTEGFSNASSGNATDQDDINFFTKILNENEPYFRENYGAVLKKIHYSSDLESLEDYTFDNKLRA